MSPGTLEATMDIAPVARLGASELSRQLAAAGCYVIPEIIQQWTHDQQWLAYAWACAAPKNWLTRWVFGGLVKPDFLVHGS